MNKIKENLNKRLVDFNNNVKKLKKGRPLGVKNKKVDSRRYTLDIEESTFKKLEEDYKNKSESVSKIVNDILRNHYFSEKKKIEKIFELIEKELEECYRSKLAQKDLRVKEKAESFLIDRLSGFCMCLKNSVLPIIKNIKNDYEWKLDDKKNRK